MKKIYITPEAIVMENLSWLMTASGFTGSDGSNTIIEDGGNTDENNVHDANAKGNSGFIEWD